MYPFPSLEPVCCSMSSSNCCFLICIQTSQEADQVVWYSHLLKDFPQFVVIHTVKGFGIVNKAEVDDFLGLSCFFYDPKDIDNLISDSSNFSKSTLNITGSWRWLGEFWRILNITLLACEMSTIECNCVVVWTLFGIALLWDWNKNWPFPILWPLLSFPYVLAYWVQHFHSIIF